MVSPLPATPWTMRFLCRWFLASQHIPHSLCELGLHAATTVTDGIAASTVKVIQYGIDNGADTGQSVRQLWPEIEFSVKATDRKLGFLISLHKPSLPEN